MKRSNVSAATAAGLLFLATMCFAAMNSHLPMGMNLANEVYWRPQCAFTNILLSSQGDWEVDSVVSPGVWRSYIRGVLHLMERDTNGYPLELPQTVPGKTAEHIVSTQINRYYPPGRYVLLYDGEGTFARWGGLQFVSGEQSPGRIVCTYEGNGAASILRITSSVRGNHVRNVRIVPEALEGTDIVTNPFRPEFINAVRDFHMLRYNGFFGVPRSLDSLWSERRLPGFWTQAADQWRVGQGVAIEYGIKLSNLTGTDGWFCIPFKADDDYIRRYAMLVKEQLDPALKIYLEYSNELWNWAFTQAHYVGQNADGVNCDCGPGADSIQQKLREIAQTYCGGPDEYCHPRKDAYMAKRVFDIWLSVFTGADRDRLIRVLGVQQANAGPTDVMLGYLSDKGGCDAVSPSAYLGGNMNFPTAQEILDEANAAFATQFSDRIYAQADVINSHKNTGDYGDILFVCYEAGSHLAKIPTDVGFDVVNEANNTEGMYDLYGRMYDILVESRVNCTLFGALGFVGNPAEFGHLDYVEQASEDSSQWTWKWKALMDGNTAKSVGVERAPIPAVRVPSAARTYSPFVLLNGNAGQRMLHTRAVRVFDLKGNLIGMNSSGRVLAGANQAEGIYLLEGVSGRSVTGLKHYSEAAASVQGICLPGTEEP